MECLVNSLNMYLLIKYYQYMLNKLFSKVHREMLLNFKNSQLFFFYKYYNLLIINKFFNKIKNILEQAELHDP